MSFPWNDNIPGPNDPFSQSQGQIQTNLNTLNSVFSVDHIPYNPVSATQGQHKQITFNNVTAPSAPISPVGISYTKSVNSISELFYRNATKESQITFSGLTTSLGSGGMPGGLQIRCGTGSTPTGATFSPPFPTACVAVVICADNSGSQVNVSSKSPIGFVAQEGGSPGGVVSLYYIAIGY